MDDNKRLLFAARLAFSISLLLLVVKFVAYFLTDSKAVLSDAIESIVNVVTGALMMVSISISIKPVDQDHPYGHGKVESFSAGFEGGLIILAAIIILFEAIPQFFVPVAPRNMGAGILLLGGAGIVTMIVSFFLLHSGKKLKSEALAADGRHLMTDFHTSAGVIAGLFLVKVTGYLWLDPLVACLVALNILGNGVELAGKSFGSLMDKADPVLLERITSALNRIKKPGWLYPHKLRCLRSGRYHHVDLHIIMPRYRTLEQVHEAEQEITEALFAELGEEGDIMIHTDPCEDIYCRSCEVDPCPERKVSFKTNDDWAVEKVTGTRVSDPLE